MNSIAYNICANSFYGGSKKSKLMEWFKVLSCIRSLCDLELFNHIQPEEKAPVGFGLPVDEEQEFDLLVVTD